MIFLSEFQERYSTSDIIVRYHVKEKTDSNKMPNGEVVLDKKSSSEDEEEKLMSIKRPTKRQSDESEEQETDVSKCTIMLSLVQVF